MVKVKICGITSPGDARMVVESGADALGFVFAPSPRQIAPDRAKYIIKRLPPFVTAVGVFVDDEIERVLDIAAYTGLKAVQLHGRETPGYVEKVIEESCRRLTGAKPSPPPLVGGGRGRGIFNIPGEGTWGGISSKIPMGQFWVIKAIRMRTRRDLILLKKYKANAFLLDSYERGRLGGTGKTFPWELAREALNHIRFKGTIILAGGLNPENVQEAIRTVRPYGVDVSSGVESSPGKKDRQLVREFIRAAKCSR